MVYLHIINKNSTFAYTIIVGLVKPEPIKYKMNNDIIKVVLYNGMVVETPRFSECVEVYESSKWKSIAVFEPKAWMQAEALKTFLSPIYEDAIRIKRFY